MGPGKQASELCDQIVFSGPSASDIFKEKSVGNRALFLKSAKGQDWLRHDIELACEIFTAIHHAIETELMYMRKGKYGEVGKRFLEYILDTKSGAGLIDAVSFSDWDRGRVPDKEGPKKVSHEWESTALEFRKENGLLFDNRGKADICSLKCGTRIGSGETVKAPTLNVGLLWEIAANEACGAVKAWTTKLVKTRKENDEWHAARSQWKKDHPEAYAFITGPYQEFLDQEEAKRQAKGVSATKKKRGRKTLRDARWHVYSEYILDRAGTLISWRGKDLGPDDVKPVPEEEMRRIRKRHRKSRPGLIYNAFLKANPEIKALCKLKDEFFDKFAKHAKYPAWTPASEAHPVYPTMKRATVSRTVKVACKGCNKTLSVTAAKMGKKATCKKCKTETDVPGNLPVMEKLRESSGLYKNLVIHPPVNAKRRVNHVPVTLDMKLPHRAVDGTISMEYRRVRLRGDRRLDPMYRSIRGMPPLGEDSIKGITAIAKGSRISFRINEDYERKNTILEARPVKKSDGDKDPSKEEMEKNRLSNRIKADEFVFLSYDQGVRIPATITIVKAKLVGRKKGINEWSSEVLHVIALPEQDIVHLRKIDKHKKELRELRAERKPKRGQHVNRKFERHISDMMDYRKDKTVRTLIDVAEFYGAALVVGEELRNLGKLSYKCPPGVNRTNATRQWAAICTGLGGTKEHPFGRANEFGIRCSFINAAYTSTTCHRCGSRVNRYDIVKGSPRPGRCGEHAWCPGCEEVLHSDVNAAINIGARFLGNFVPNTEKYDRDEFETLDHSVLAARARAPVAAPLPGRVRRRYLNEGKDLQNKARKDERRENEALENDLVTA